MAELHVNESKESHGATSAKWPIVWLWHYGMFVARYAGRSVEIRAGITGFAHATAEKKKTFFALL